MDLWAVCGEGLCFYRQVATNAPVMRLYAGAGAVSNMAIEQLAAGGPVIRLYTFATGRLSDITHLARARDAGSLSISPDGKWLLHEQLDRVDSDLMLVENFR